MNRALEEQLEREGFYVSTTVGMSMFPMLRNRRDRIVLHPVGEKRLKKYDLPLYRRPDGKYVLHRIIGVKEGYYITRGDNTYHKEKVPNEWVIGFVVEFYRKGKYQSATQKGYRLYARFWNWIFPLRFLFFYGRIFLSKVKHTIGKLFRRAKK